MILNFYVLPRRSLHLSGAALAQTLMEGKAMKVSWDRVPGIGHIVNVRVGATLLAYEVEVVTWNEHGVPCAVLAPSASAYARLPILSA